MNLPLSVPLADGSGMMGDFGAGWMILMVLFWGAIVLGVVWLARGRFEGRREHRSVTPTEVLDRRFAEGAISADDYRARREALVNEAPELNVNEAPELKGDDRR